jgi:hypothetical protein
MQQDAARIPISKRCANDLLRELEETQRHFIIVVLKLIFVAPLLINIYKLMNNIGINGVLRQVKTN